MIRRQLVAGRKMEFWTRVSGGITEHCVRSMVSADVLDIAYSV